MQKCTLKAVLVLSAGLATGWMLVPRDVFPSTSGDFGGEKPLYRAEAKNVALVIGNANYPTSRLRNPLRDARAMDRLLEDMGFVVTRLENGSHRDMQRAINTFVAQLPAQGTGIFYFSGHGVQSLDTSLLLPVDADPQSMPSPAKGVDLRRLITAMSVSRGRRQDLVILDMCRESWPGRGAVDVAPLTAHALKPPTGMLIAYATRPGGSANDGSGGAGVYTAALLEQMRAPRRQAIEVFERASVAVGLTSERRQVPQFISALTRPLYLGLPPAMLAQGGSPPAAVKSSGLAELSRGIIPESGEARYELLFWESIKDSQQAADYEAYLEAFPNGRFAPLARARARYYRGKEVPPDAKGQSAPDRPRPARGEDLKLQSMAAEYTVVVTANVRERPSADAPRIAVVEKGGRVRVIGRLADRDWYQILTADGKKGFVYGTLIQPVTKPTMASPPPRPPSQPAPPAASGGQVKSLEAFSDCNDCPEMVVLAAGAFVMGAAEGDPSERPAHRVTIRQPFAIGKYEVTVSQWQACVATGGCTDRSEASGSKDDLPVRDVSWDDAQRYVKWLSSATGGRYRLPTEAEWEYAARAGTKTRYWWGDSVEGGKANCKDCGGQWDRRTPAVVGSYAPNAFGLYDMNGNVWEWVSDCWHPSYVGAPADERSWEDKDCSQRVLRGGSWRNDATYVYSSSRFYYDGDVRYALHGFRVAKSLP